MLRPDGRPCDWYPGERTEHHIHPVHSEYTSSDPILAINNLTESQDAMAKKGFSVTKTVRNTYEGDDLWN